jgi:cytochrome c-type biogenesis protein CcmF
MVVAAGLLAAGMRHPYALMSFLLCTFVTTTIAMEFFKGAMAIRAKDGGNLCVSLIELTRRNTRRYGGYLVHLGVVVMFIGFTGSAFNQDVAAEIAQGESFRLGRYSLTLRKVEQGQNSNYLWAKAMVFVAKDARGAGYLMPERRLYLADEQPSTEVGIRRRLDEDLYVSFTGGSEDGKKAVLHAYIFPLVSWIWIGYLVVLAGTLVCLIPSADRRMTLRAEVGKVVPEAHPA